MDDVWYYVLNGQRVGPVTEQEILKLINSKTLNEESYIWTQGFDNWVRLKNVDRFNVADNFAEDDDVEKTTTAINVESIIDSNSMNMDDEDHVGHEDTLELVNWNGFKEDERVFLLKTGMDRNGPEVEYGPFSLKQLKRAYKEKRINGKTHIFTKGMRNWSFLADIPIYDRISSDFPPIITDHERRRETRKPFVARMFFHDNNIIYEGVCRDISVGGLQILISDFPGKAGDEITMNVHPDNSEYSFVAKGEIVRLLEGGHGFSLRFTDLPGEAQQAIKNYIRKN